LRSLVAPLYLIASVAISYLAAFGLSVLHTACQPARSARRASLRRASASTCGQGQGTGSPSSQHHAPARTLLMSAQRRRSLPQPTSTVVPAEAIDARAASS